MDHGMLHALIVIFLALVSLSQAKSRSILFNFGDSNSDTGNACSVLGCNSGANGRLFFHRNTGRFCDGRLMLDFFCQNLSIPLLSPYMRSFDGEFHSGANFAFSGSMARPVNCFSLPYQIQHFHSFKSMVLAQQGEKRIIQQNEFEKAVYLFDIGQNDLTITMNYHPVTTEGTTSVIHDVLKNIKSGVESLYEKGARKFWIHNTGPLGCLTINFPGKSYPRWITNDHGCFEVAMNGSIQLNTQLKNLVEELRTTLPRSTIVYVDVFSIKYDLFINYDKYGFQSKFDDCGKYGLCPEGSKYIIWDMVHYTELANSMVASKILSGAYSDPPIKLIDLCKAREKFVVHAIKQSNWI